MRGEEEPKMTMKTIPSALEGSVLTEGRWADNTPWQFIISSREVDPKLCTAVFCVTTYENKLVLVEHQSRGWELPGGHIDEGESLEEALEREVLEETGAVIKDASQFGIKKVSPPNPVPYRDRPGQFYPHPDSYVPYFVAETTEMFGTELAPDVKSVKIVGLDEAKSMLAQGHNHDKILDFLVEQGLLTIHK